VIAALTMFFAREPIKAATVKFYDVMTPLFEPRSKPAALKARKSASKTKPRHDVRRVQPGVRRPRKRRKHDVPQQNDRDTQSTGARERAIEAYDNARAQALDGVDGSPLLALGGGLALGALIAALLPRTRTEERILGEFGGRITAAPGAPSTPPGKRAARSCPNSTSQRKPARARFSPSSTGSARRRAPAARRRSKLRATKADCWTADFDASGPP
jgi:hypothetical protein